MKLRILMTIGASISAGLVSYIKLRELGLAGTLVSIGAVLVIFPVLRAYSYPGLESADAALREPVIERLSLLLPLLFVLFIIIVALTTYLII